MARVVTACVGVVAVAGQGTGRSLTSGTRAPPAPSTWRASRPLQARNVPKPLKAASTGTQDSLEFPPQAEVPDNTDTPAEMEAALPVPRGPVPEVVLEDMRKFIVSDLNRLLKTGNLTESRYSPEILFTDPVTRTTGLGVYKLLMNSLRLMFKFDFKVHSAEITGPAEVTTRWTITLKQEQIPWQPTVVITGKTFYAIDLERRMVLSHVDEWDSADHNKFFSVDALFDMMGQMSRGSNTPNLESPEYTVLRRRKSFEIRKYTPFLVAETEMTAGSGPAGGSGFGELAKFIFGGNEKKLTMDMTTPVLSSAGQSGPENNRMQFVMSSRFGSPDDLPKPESPSVVCKTEDPGVIAAIEFSGWPLDFEVVNAEKTLRAALKKEGLSPLPGYKLARYNDPGTLPMMRRNEVLIRLEGLKL